MDTLIVLVFLGLSIFFIKKILLGKKIHDLLKEHNEANRELNKLTIVIDPGMEEYKIPEKIEDFYEGINLRIKRRQNQVIWTFIKYAELKKSLSREEKAWVLYYLEQTEDKETSEKLLNFLFFK